MKRKLLVGEGTVNHCTWRGHNLEYVLGSDDAKQRFLDLLALHKDAHGIEIYSYCVMDNHPHVLVRCTKGQLAFSAFWKVVNYRFARWYNARNKARGQVIMERMRSGQVQDGEHQLRVMRYGDLNPVRAGLVGRAKRWPWSSHRHYAYGEHNALITDAPEYLALGETAPRRRRAYLQLFAVLVVDGYSSIVMVLAPFIGSDTWISTQRTAHGLSPPS